MGSSFMFLYEYARISSIAFDPFWKYFGFSTFTPASLSLSRGLVFDLMCHYGRCRYLYPDFCFWGRTVGVASSIQCFLRWHSLSDSLFCTSSYGSSISSESSSRSIGRDFGSMGFAINLLNLRKPEKMSLKTAKYKAALSQKFRQKIVFGTEIG